MALNLAPFDRLTPREKTVQPCLKSEHSLPRFFSSHYMTHHYPKSKWNEKSRNVLRLSTEVSCRPTLQKMYLLKQGI